MDPFQAIVLAGGSSRRVDGVDKPFIDIAGRPMLSYVLHAVRAAAKIIVVGPHRQGAEADLRWPEGTLQWCREAPPGGGPVAAIEAGARFVDAALVVVLAADLPYVGPAIPVLLDRLTGAPGTRELAMLRAHGRPNYLAAAWRTGSLRHRLSCLDRTGGASMQSLVAGAAVLEIADDDGWSRDCDTWSDVERARYEHHHRAVRLTDANSTDGREPT